MKITADEISALMVIEFALTTAPVPTDKLQTHLQDSLEWVELLIAIERETEIDLDTVDPDVGMTLEELAHAVNAA